MPQRQLTFNNYSEAAAEVDRLHRDGWTAEGQWNLAQICDHLAFFIEGSLDGHKFRVPWLFKVLFGRMVLKRILSQRKMKSGVPTPQTPLPDASTDEATAVVRLLQAIKRLQAHEGEMHDSPFFGHLTPEQWRELHLIHCAHHLGYLTPK